MQLTAKKLFVGTANAEDRSIMNVCFVMKPEYADLEKAFIDFASEKRHRWYQGTQISWRFQSIYLQRNAS